MASNVHSLVSFYNFFNVMPVTQLKLTTFCDPKIATPAAPSPTPSSPPSFISPQHTTSLATTQNSSPFPYLPIEKSSEEIAASNRRVPKSYASPHPAPSFPSVPNLASPFSSDFSSPVNIVARSSSPRRQTVSHRKSSSYRPSGQYLRPNARFVGEQQSGRARYQIKVTFKTVDLPNLLVSGYLQINGLTEHHPEITTFFNGQIINNPLFRQLRQDRLVPNQEHIQSRYSFLTDNKEWGSSLANDIDHWRKLTGSTHMSDHNLKGHLKQIRDGDSDDRFLYMRWKEEFLVPDSRIRQIHGASFEDFYYIVLCIGNNPNTTKSAHSVVEVPEMAAGTISGLYYHQSLEKFQSLSLKYVPDHGKSGIFAFC